MAYSGSADPGWGPGRFALSKDGPTRLGSPGRAAAAAAQLDQPKVPRSAFGRPQGPPGAAPPPPAPSSEMNDALKNLAGQVAMEGGRQAMKRASELSGDVQDYIARGPDGIRKLCCIGGVLQSVTGVVGIFSVLTILVDPFAYIINLVNTGCGVLILAIEVDPEWFEKYPELGNIQRIALEWFRALTQVWARGVFYLYLGSVDVAESDLGLLFFVGLYIFFCGIVTLYSSTGENANVQFILEKIKSVVGSVPRPRLPKRGGGGAEDPESGSNYTSLAGDPQETST